MTLPAPISQSTGSEEPTRTILIRMVRRAAVEALVAQLVASGAVVAPTREVRQ